MQLYLLKDRGVRTKFDPKMSIISDVRATILIKTIDVSPRVITVASYMKYMKLVSSEAAHSIVLGAKKSFRTILRNFVQGFLNPKDWSFRNPFCAKIQYMKTDSKLKLKPSKSE